MVWRWNSGPLHARQAFYQWATLPALLFPLTGNKTEAQTGGLICSTADQVTAFWPSSYSGSIQEHKVTPKEPSTVFCHTLLL